MGAAEGARRPLLFLDVDGPLMPFGEPGPSRSAGSGDPVARANPLLVRIDPSMGPQLAALGYEVVWATTWQEEANACVAPLLGLPPLPVLSRPELLPTEEQDARAGRHWKTRLIVSWAEGRPFAWVDDEISRADRDWVRAHHDGHALLHQVDPARGLGPEDFLALRLWAEGLADRAAR